MTKIITTFLSIAFFLNGCFSNNEKELNPKATIGNVDIKYLSNKTVTSLEIPPDLTKPSLENSFRLSEYDDDSKNIVNFTNNEVESKKSKTFNDEKISIIKNGNITWLSFKEGKNNTWDLVRNFFKSEGFSFKKINKELGILETDYLENRPDIPDQSVGFIRSIIRRGTGQSYMLPVLDMYRIRIESENNDLTNIFITLSSIQEVLTSAGTDDENTIWQAKQTDINIEKEMLLRLMIYLGGDKATSINKIIEAKEENEINLSIGKSFNGYTKLTFQSKLLETWDQMSWAMDRIGIDLQDKDIKEKTFYINESRTADQGIISKLFGDEAIKNVYQIQLKEIAQNTTEVYFNDITEKNEQKTIDFSYDFFNKVYKQFK